MCNHPHQQQPGHFYLWQKNFQFSRLGRNQCSLYLCSCAPWCWTSVRSPAILFLPYVVSSLSCQKSLHKKLGLPNIDIFWRWIYFYCSHFVAINISNSYFLIQGIIFQAECFSQYFLLKLRKTNLAQEFKFDNLKY